MFASVGEAMNSPLKESRANTWPRSDFPHPGSGEVSHTYGYAWKTGKRYVPIVQVAITVDQHFSGKITNRLKYSTNSMSSAWSSSLGQVAGLVWRYAMNSFAVSGVTELANLPSLSQTSPIWSISTKPSLEVSAARRPSSNTTPTTNWLFTQSSAG